MYQYFKVSAIITIIAVLLALIFLGPAAAITTVILIAIEIAFSFDNAVINAKVLERMSRFWQHLFLTLGMIIALGGMRLLFPILIVMVTAGLPWHEVINDALHNPQLYAKHLGEAHAAISAFGGSFLLTLTLYFLLDDVREELWLKRLETQLQRIGGNFWLPPTITSIVICLIAAATDHEPKTVLVAGIAGTLGYTAIKFFVDFLGKFSPKGSRKYVGWPAFLAFMYLQVLDASFSFDGVLGAFAITDKVFLIALGLGVGALWVRSLTVFMVNQGTLKDYKYLEHGAHYAILVLAAALLGSIFYEVPDALTGVVGLGIIFASFQTSREVLAAERAAVKRSKK